ncbi:MAG: hypothetical protein JNN30_06150 [Rhodanobacteraceae bacterium]|nr:hypothetical protein [Rhodanobacteraceae bacterium]
MSEQNPRLEGVPGTEAVASKHGYYYQDVATALAWTHLAPTETLFVEVAEDYAIGERNGTDVHQFKHQEASITLLSVLDFLDRVFDLRERNASKSLTFVFRTTSRIGLEKELVHRPDGLAGLTYWRDVQQGTRQAAPLINVLRAIATDKSRLQRFLAQKSDAEASSELIAKVTWAAREPDTQQILDALGKRLSQIGHEQHGLQWSEGRRLVPAVIKAVIEKSIEKTQESRSVCWADLQELIAESLTQRVPNNRYQQLLEQEELLKNPPIEQVDSDLKTRLSRLRVVRFFGEATTTALARDLAADVRAGGKSQIGGKELRAFVMSWCARVLADEDTELATALVEEAKLVAPQDHVSMVEALLLGRTDIEAARRLVGAYRGELSQTIRYALMRNQDRSAALRWIAETGLTPSDLDPDGNCLVLGDLLGEQQHEDALRWLDRVAESAFDVCPALWWVGAQVLVACSVVPLLRERASQGPPVVDELPLVDGENELVWRRRAAEMFGRFHDAATRYDLPDTAAAALDYRLWLGLHDRASVVATKAEISQLWNRTREEGRAEWIPLALSAGLEIDVQEWAKTIDQRALTYGGLTANDARARAALFLRLSPADCARQLPSIRDHLRPYIHPSFLESLEIQALVFSGRRSEAVEKLAKATQLPDAIRARLTLEISDGVDESMLAAFRKAAEEEQDPTSLQNLVAALVRAQQLPEAIEHAISLFDLTKDREHAVAALHLLINENRWGDVVEFLDSHPILIQQSDKLSEMYLDALFQRGRWTDARRHVGKYGDRLSPRRRLELGMYLAVYSGDWGSLDRLLEAVLETLGYTPEQLLQFARVATALGRTHTAKRLTKTAAIAAPGAATVLLNAYTQATRGQWEEEEEPGEWLRKAIALSDESGPMQEKTLADVVEMIPGWRKRSDALSDGIRMARLYMGLVAEAVNQPLSTLLVGTAEANKGQREPRRRTPISAFFGGTRTPMQRPSEIALDQTALLTLGQLGLLPKVLKIFDCIHLPHATGAWLFYELGEVKFHQPSRIREAGQLLAVVAADDIDVVSASGTCSARLKAEVGADLAQMVRVAELQRETRPDVYVVRPGPIDRIGSLTGDKKADLGAAKPLFRSCVELVRSLHHHGLIGDDVRDQAFSYLTRSDQGLPDDSTIELGACLYLDDITVTHFQRLNLWRTLKNGGFRLFVHADVVAEAMSLREFEASTGHLTALIEAICQFMIDGQEQGRVLFLRAPKRGADDESDSDSRFLLPQLGECESGVGAIVVDDRAANRLSDFVFSDGTSVPIRTTLDVLNWLRAEEALSDKDWLSKRTELRRGGYLFIPAIEEEILAALRSSNVRDGALVESPALRALRESYLLAQTSQMALVPDELPWLMDVRTQAQQALATLWSDDADDIETAVRADWIVEFGSLEGFLRETPAPWDRARFLDLDAMNANRLLFGAFSMKPHRRRAYMAWLDRYLLPVARSKPPLFETIYVRMVENLKLVPQRGSDSPGSLQLTSEQVSQAVLAFSQNFVNELPKSLRDRVFADRALLEELKIPSADRITVHLSGTPRFDANRLFSVVGVAYESAKPVSVDDEAGTAWSVAVAEDASVRCIDSSEQRSFGIDHAPLLHPDPARRQAYIVHRAQSFGIGEQEVKGWLEEAGQGPVHYSRFEMLDKDLEDSPIGVANHIEDALAKEATQYDLVPLSRRYYERLVPAANGHTALPDYVLALRQREPAVELAAQVRHELLWSVHSLTVPLLAIAKMDELALRDLIREMLPSIDLWSLTGLIQGLLARPDCADALRDVVAELLSAFLSYVHEDCDRLSLTVHLAGMVDAMAHVSGALHDAPVYWRRLATFAHAALVERVVLRTNIDLGQFSGWANEFFSTFAVASLADIPVEPRWSGFMLSSGQLKQELLARVWAALVGHRDALADFLGASVFGEEEGSLESQCHIVFGALPGPLEGGLPAAALPDFMVKQLDDLLDQKSVALETRALALAHLISLWAPPSEKLERITTFVDDLALSDVDPADDSSSYWELLLSRLSLAAASSRHRLFADAVRRLIECRDGIPLFLRLRSGIAVCGVEDSDGLWCEAVAAHVSHCISRDLTKEDAELVIWFLRVLCDAKPVLRVHVAPVVARLSGVAKRIG